MQRISPEKGLQVIELYREKKLPTGQVQRQSQREVARRLGISAWSVRNILMKKHEPRRTRSEARTRYPKNDFSCDLAEQARIIGYMDDCAARYYDKQVGIQTSTTHPAHIELFNEHFGGYGHARKLSGYTKRYSLYFWHTYVYLNPTFQFVLEYKRNPMKILTEIAGNGCEMMRIASLTDAEGWVGIKLNEGYPRVVLAISNNNRRMLDFTRKTIGGNIGRNGDCYQLVLGG